MRIGYVKAHDISWTPNYGSCLGDLRELDTLVRKVSRSKSCLPLLPVWVYSKGKEFALPWMPFSVQGCILENPERCVPLKKKWWKKTTKCIHNP